MVDEQRKQLVLNLKDREKIIEEKLRQIKESTKDNEIENLYDEILKLDNKNENYIVSYLEFLFRAKKKEKLDLILKDYRICLSDSKYNYLTSIGINGPRKNAREKIKWYINFIKDNEFIKALIKDESKYKDSKNYIAFNIISEISHQEENLDLKPKNIVTWKEEELYLNKLFYSLLESMIKIMNYYSKSNDALENAEKTKLYKEYKEKIIKEENESKKKIYKDIITSIILSESSFYNYIINFNLFLNNIDIEYNQRFEDLELIKTEDKLLFEDYLQFISNYKFDGNEEIIINMWKEAFLPLNNEEKKKFLNNIEEENKKKISPAHFIFDENTDTLEIKKLGYNKETIKDISDYSFYCLITNINNLYKGKNIEWIKNVSLKPYNYYNKLFVCKKRKIWKDLLKKIFVSKVFIQIITKFYGEKEKNVLQDDSIIDTIINNIRFFIYETNYFGVTHDYSLITYEYGLYKNNGDKNESIRLLIYYGFFIVCNIHELGGHVYVRLQFYSTLESGYQSLDIEEYNINKYTL